MHGNGVRCSPTISWRRFYICSIWHRAAPPMIPLDEGLRPTWLFGNTVHEGCDRGGFYEQAQFAEEYGSPLGIVKLGAGDR
jgi:Ni,Fe-hydrogenase I small subunit